MQKAPNPKHSGGHNEKTKNLRIIGIEESKDSQGKEPINIFNKIIADSILSSWAQVKPYPVYDIPHDQIQQFHLIFLYCFFIICLYYDFLTYGLCIYLLSILLMTGPVSPGNPGKITDVNQPSSWGRCCFYFQLSQ